MGSGPEETLSTCCGAVVKIMVMVRLDNHHIGAGPATVIARVSSVKEYHSLSTDRDGARDPSLRLWDGDFPVGSRVVMKQLVCGTGRGIFERV